MKKFITSAVALAAVTATFAVNFTQAHAESDRPVAAQAASAQANPDKAERVHKVTKITRKTISNGYAKPVSDARYSTIINRYAASYGVPSALAHAVIRVESNFRANARGSAGEIGLMQLKPATARMMGYSGSAKGLYNPETNIRFGMKYLAKAHLLGGGSVCGTILKYNAGHGAKRMNPVSARYCSKVKRLM